MISSRLKTRSAPPACALPCVDIAVDHVLRVLQNVTGVVGEHDLDILPQALVVFDIIHSGKRMHGVKAEHIAEAFLVEAVRIRIDFLPVHFVHADQMVPHLVRRIGKLHIELLAGHTERPQHDRETVPGKNREHDPHILAAEFFPDVVGDLLNSRVVSLRPGDHSLRDAENVPVLQFKSFFPGSFDQAVPDQGNEIVAFLEDWHDDSSGGYSCVPHTFFPCFLLEIWLGIYSFVSRNWQQKKSLSTGQLFSSRLIVADASRAPYPDASASVAPRTSPITVPEKNASPAPVVSTTFVGQGGQIPALSAPFS